MLQVRFEARANARGGVTAATVFVSPFTASLCWTVLGASRGGRKEVVSEEFYRPPEMGTLRISHEMGTLRIYRGAAENTLLQSARKFAAGAQP